MGGQTWRRKRLPEGSFVPAPRTIFLTDSFLLTQPCNLSPPGRFGNSLSVFSRWPLAALVVRNLFRNIGDLRKVLSKRSAISLRDTSSRRAAAVWDRIQVAARRIEFDARHKATGTSTSERAIGH